MIKTEDSSSKMDQTNVSVPDKVISEHSFVSKIIISKVTVATRRA